MILNIPVTLGEKGCVWSLMSPLQHVKGVASDTFLPSLTLNVSILKTEMTKSTLELMRVIKSYYSCQMEYYILLMSARSPEQTAGVHSFNNVHYCKYAFFGLYARCGHMPGSILYLGAKKEGAA